MAGKGIQFIRSVPRWLMVRILGKYVPSIKTGRLSCIRYGDVESPALPDEEWVRIMPILSGICGSDLSAIACKGSPYFSPFTSTPFVLGHELVGKIIEVGTGVPQHLKAGMRVVIEPALHCRVRGIKTICQACENGEYASCENITAGSIKAGIQTGYCASTGGGWSNASVVAHHCQVYPVPDKLPDEVAVLAEPMACAVHSITKLFREDISTILVIGCGTIGLLSIAAYRMLGGKAKILAAGCYANQIKMAEVLGADKTFLARDSKALYNEVFDYLYGDGWRMRIHQPEIGKPVLIGGVDAVVDCVGTSSSIDDSLRLARPGGSVILTGMPGIPSGIDWTSLWYKSLKVRGSYAYGFDDLPDGRKAKSMDIALELLLNHQNKFKQLVSGFYPLQEYRKALQESYNAGRLGKFKVVFKIN